MKPHKLPQELIDDLEPEIKILIEMYHKAVKEEEKTIKAHVDDFKMDQINTILEKSKSRRDVNQ